MDTPSFNSQSEGIGHAIADKKPVIPTRQRSYAWTKDEVNELYNDLADAISKGRPDYFLGLIVAARRDSKRPEVVDGQQRLATCAMLLAAIRDHFYNSSPQSKHASKYQQEFLIDFDTTDGAEVPHLKLNIDDSPFFLDYVLRPPDDPIRLAKTAAEAKKNTRSKRPSHKLIQEAADIARRRVKTIVDGFGRPADQDRALVRWVDYIRNQAKIIWFEVPDYANAYIIFETLNDRGLDLSKSDLLKNYLFGCVGERYEEVHQPWSKMVGAIETVSRKDIAATYIRHFWISTHGPVRERQLFNEIKEEVRGVDAAIILANSLEEHASLYAAILSSDHEAWSQFGEETREHIKNLVMLKAERIRPLLLAVAKNFAKDEIKKAMHLFTNWTVRLIISSKLGGVVEATIGDLAKAVSDKKITTTKGIASQKSVTVAIPGDAEFEEAFAVARVTQHELARYYLHELEYTYKRTLAGEEQTTRTNRRENVCTLEHILPGKPSAEWGFTSPRELEEALEDLTRIGNLALMRKGMNEDAANSPFPDKLALYKAEKGIHLTSLLAQKYSNCKRWGRKEINERQRMLAGLALKTWPLKV